MSPTRDIGPGSPTNRDLQASLTFQPDPAGTLVARLAVHEPDRWRVELVMTGDQLARLLAGETVAVAGEMHGVQAPHDEQPTVEPDAVEPEAQPDNAAREPSDAEEPTPALPTAYGTSLDEPPAGTEPIAHSPHVTPGDTVVAYIRGRWLDAVVVRRDIGSLLVAYSRPGSFGPVQQRITTDRVRRRT